MSLENCLFVLRYCYHKETGLCLTSSIWPPINYFSFIASSIEHLHLLLFIIIGVLIIPVWMHAWMVKIGYYYLTLYLCVCVCLYVCLLSLSICLPLSFFLFLCITYRYMVSAQSICMSLVLAQCLCFYQGLCFPYVSPSVCLWLSLYFASGDINCISGGGGG